LEHNFRREATFFASVGIPSAIHRRRVLCIRRLFLLNRPAIRGLCADKTGEAVMNILSKISFAGMAALLLAGAAVAAPETSVAVGHSDVAYGDLDLGNAQDAARLLSRIRVAARHECGGMANRNPYYSLNQNYAERRFKQCQEQLVSKAVAGLSVPQVSDAYTAATPGKAVK
jgi:UrcA family protein